MYEHKKGATLSLAGSLTPPAGGTLPSFTGWTGSCQIRMLNGNLVETLEFTWLNVNTGTLRIYKLDTSLWPVGVAEIDVKFTSPSGETLFTSTQQISIVKGITGA
jgi:hypothetical protein